MRPFFTLLGKQLSESRWFMLICTGALFLFGWLNVYVTSLAQTRLRAQFGRDAEQRLEMMRRMAGGDVELTTAVMEMQFWVHPFIWLPLIVWAINRGSLAVAGEVERGTMDLMLSRPIARPAYLGAQVFVALLGLAWLASMMLAGNQAAARFNTLESPPTAWGLARPTTNLAALGLAVYGIALFQSSWDVVRWRSILFTSVIVVAGFVGAIVSVVPGINATFRQVMRSFSLFTAYNPIDAVSKAEFLSRNLSILGGIGLAGVVMALCIFNARDLPTSG